MNLNTLRHPFVLNTKIHVLLNGFIILLFTSSLIPLSAQSIDDANDTLIKQYSASKGNKVIIFDSSNIKQFWVNNSVLSSNGLIHIDLLQNNESEPLKIQLMNVDDSMDCTIEILTENNDVSFSVFNKSLELLSSSKREEAFLDYKRLSSTFHLDDTNDYLFNLKFFSTPSSVIKIKTIILSFSDNKINKIVPGAKIVAPPFSAVSSKSFCENGDFEKVLSGQQLDNFMKTALAAGCPESYLKEHLFPQKISIGVPSNTVPSLYLSSDNPLSGKYSLMIDTAQPTNKAYFGYYGAKKGNCIYSGLIRGLGNNDSTLTITPYYYDSQEDKKVYLNNRSITITIKPDTYYEFQGIVRFSEVKAPIFSLNCVGTGKYLLDNLQFIPLE